MAAAVSALMFCPASWAVAQLEIGHQCRGDSSGPHSEPSWTAYSHPVGRERSNKGE